MTKPRKNYSPEQKGAILLVVGTRRVPSTKRHLVEKAPVSDLCDELSLNPNVFYNPQKQFFENGAAGYPQFINPLIQDVPLAISRGTNTNVLFRARWPTSGGGLNQPSGSGGRKRVILCSTRLA